MTSPMTGFSHVQLLVSDVRASEQWYTTVLGMDRFAADESIGYVALRHKPSGVAIVLSTRAERQPRRVRARSSGVRGARRPDARDVGRPPHRRRYRARRRRPRARQAVVAAARSRRQRHRARRPRTARYAAYAMVGSAGSRRHRGRGATRRRDARAGGRRRLDACPRVRSTGTCARTVLHAVSCVTCYTVDLASQATARCRSRSTSRCTRRTSRCSGSSARPPG